MHRFTSHHSMLTAGLAAGALVVAVALSGCGAGQVAQTAIQEPAVNGASATSGDVSLRNIHLRAAQSTDYVQPGRRIELLFTAINNSADVDDKLVGLTSDIGAVTLTGDTTLPAAGLLIVGTPDGQIGALDTAESAKAATAAVALAKPITNGLTYAFTFTFQRAGQLTVSVPISAGESPRREAEAQGDNPPEGH